jgi:hypothetical protein
VTPVPWGISVRYAHDTTGKSFVFTLKNPSGTGPLKFPLRYFAVHEHHGAIYSGPGHGPTFGAGHDLYMAENSHGNLNSYSNLGVDYLNLSGLLGAFGLTGARNFQTTEIEVFELIA